MKQTEAFDLQRFAEPVQGAKLLYLLRILKDKTKNDAKVLAFQTEGTTTISKDADSTATKDGTIRIPSPAEIEISLTALLAKGDTMIDDLKAAMLNDELIEIWEVDASQEGTGDTDGKYKSTYYWHSRPKAPQPFPRMRIPQPQKTALSAFLLRLKLKSL